MRKLLLVLGIVICVVGGIIGGIYLYDHDDVYYRGKETFQTQEDYTAFKMEVAEQTCRIGEMTVLSSEPPIVVDFEVVVPYNYKFPYGERVGTAGSWAFVIFLAVPITLMVLALIFPPED